MMFALLPMPGVMVQIVAIMGQGIYVDSARDFCGMYFGLASNDENVAGIDYSPGYLRAAAKLLVGR